MTSSQWAADSVERRPIESLIPYARNARTHSDDQVDQIARSMDEFGWTIPILLDERSEIIAGHGRVLAARKLGFAEAPCMVARGWSEAQIKAYRLADNELALHSDWNPEFLKVEFEELKLLDFNLELTGFSVEDINQYLAPGTQGLTDPDDAPDVPVNPVTRPGDLWLLGGHRLVCGDATNPVDVQKALAGAQPHLMVTDPPYGVDYDPAWRNRANWARGENHRGRALGEVTNDDRADWREAWILFPGDIAYVWHGALHGEMFKRV
jgi:ParB-like chromosome segregation protein Spo0J